MWKEAHNVPLETCIRRKPPCTCFAHTSRPIQERTGDSSAPKHQTSYPDTIPAPHIAATNPTWADRDLRRSGSELARSSVPHPTSPREQVKRAPRPMRLVSSFSGRALLLQTCRLRAHKTPFDLP